MLSEFLLAPVAIDGNRNITNIRFGLPPFPAGKYTSRSSRLDGIESSSGAEIMAIGPVGSRREVVYRAQRMPDKTGLAHLGEWVRLWRFRFGVETGVDELEPAEKLVFCTFSPVQV